MNDLRYALRMLVKNPVFTIIAVFTLALGIGANTAIFSVVNAVLLRPLPYPHPERLMLLTETGANQTEISVSFPDYVDWKGQNTVFENIAVSRRESYNLSELTTREPEQISGALVTASFFKVIGLKPQIGRVFTEEEDRAGGPQLAVISDTLWNRVFNRDPNVLGKDLIFGDQPYTVIGVMPPQMFSPRTVEVWFPLTRRSANPDWQDRDSHPGLYAWARLKSGVTIEDARAQMQGIAARSAQQYPRSNAKVGVKVTPLLENQVGEYRSSLTLLLCAVGLVLLIACANLANLLAARGAARAREFAIRKAVGAARWQIIRQLLLESLLLALIGGAAGLCLSAWGRDLLVALAPAGVKRFQETRVDFWVFGFTAVLTLGTSVLFGLWPAWQASRVNAESALKAGAHGSSDSRAARRSRELLIIAEVALTLVLLSAAGLVLKSFSRTTSVPLGFEPHDLMTAAVFLPSPAYENEKKLLNFSTALLEKLRAIPGVERAAIATNPPLMTGWQTGFLPEGMPEPAPNQRPGMEMAVIQGDYFGTLGTALLRGRAFDSRDSKDAPPVIIIDNTTAEKFFPGQDPIGKRLSMQTEPGAPKLRTIVGVAPRLKVNGFEDSSTLAQGYLPQTQQPNTALILLLRTALPQQSLEPTLKQIVAGLDPAQPVFDIRTMQAVVAETWATPKLLTFLLTTFALLALLLAAIGLYGVMAYNGERRTREIGLRLALGARRRQIVTLMLSQGMRLLAFGMALGFLGALASSRIIRGLLFEVSPLDQFIYAVVTLIVMAVTAFACWLPAHRASRVDPMVALRYE
jgi:putative ABC transport system permease protein